MTASWGRAPDPEINASGLARPIAVITAMVWSMPGVTSVWPPTISTRRPSAVCPASRMMASSSSGVVPSRSSNVNTSANGSAPLVARSLHATCTASRPRCSRAVVMGSQVTTAAHWPKSRTAQSSPMPARRSTSGRRPRYGYTSRARSSGGTLPALTGVPVREPCRGDGRRQGRQPQRRPRLARC